MQHPEIVQIPVLTVSLANLQQNIVFFLAIYISYEWIALNLVCFVYLYDFSPGVHYNTEAESKEKHGAWDPMPKVTIASPNVHSRVDSNTFTMGNPMPELTLTLCQSRL
jgi:hypothetical protein